MKVSIVIPAYNEEKVIGQTLETLAQLEAPTDWEVIIVDNASTDRTQQIALSFADRLPLRIIEEPKKGRGRARATGFAQAKGEIIFSTDADTLLPPDWATEMIAPFSDSSVVATVSAPLFYDAGPMTNWLYNTFSPSYFWVTKKLTGNYPLVGFSFAIRRDVYKKSGGFNPDLRAEEDVDLGSRVAKKGKIFFVRSVHVITSGRRWRRGPAVGMLSYALTTIFRLAGLSPDLSDVR